MSWGRWRGAPLGLALAWLVTLTAPAGAAGEEEARISIDVKEADIVDVIRLLAEVGGFQVVIHPGVSCTLTLSLEQVAWPTILDLALKSCGLGMDEEADVIRVAKVAQLTEEAAQRRRFEEERRLSEPRQVVYRRLSYARAQELAPIVKRFLSPGGDVVYDSRTNTLIIID
jgi:type IV pilus assembly protein PilQ